jgi:peroxiredoxin
MKRAGVETPMRIFSDSKLEWMTMYSTVGSDEGWSMSVHVIDTEGTIQAHQRQVDPSNACQLVMDAVESIEVE